MQIELQDDEQTLLDQLELDPQKVRDHVHWQRNSSSASKLTRSIVERGAIPDHRWKWFTDPAFNPGGRGKSRKDRFLANAGTVDEMLRHNNFLPYLRYFLFGPSLPAEAIALFAESARECGHVTSSDVVPLGKCARDLAKQFGLDRSSAPDEFYKLALELDIWNAWAESIRDSVKQMR